MQILVPVSARMDLFVAMSLGQTPALPLKLTEHTN